MIRRKSSEVLNCLSLTQILNKLNMYMLSLLFEKQDRKGFRIKARDGDFIEFRIQMAVEFFKNFDQNSGLKCSCS